MVDSLAPTFTQTAIETIYKSSFSSASGITLLHKGEETFAAIFDAVKSAQKIICLQFYIFRNDETGLELAEILKEKSRNGVSVYILHDHFGSFGTPAAFWHELREAGIKVIASHPFKWTAPFHYVKRDHRKLIIIDLEKGKQTCEIGKVLTVLHTLGIKLTLTPPTPKQEGSLDGPRS